MYRIPALAVDVRAWRLGARLKMRTTLRHLIGLALCAAAIDSQALSIGAGRGAVVVGQPLDLSFDVVLDPGADASAACVTAQLFYGDSAVNGGRVRIVTKQGAQPTQVVVQVSSSAAVDEPFVAVVVKAGCTTSLSRRFVMLAGSPVEPAQPMNAPGLPLASGRLGMPPSNAGAGASAGTGPATIARSGGGPAVSDAPAEAATRSPAAPKPRQARPVVRSPEPVVRAPSRPRLVLQSPSEWLEEQVLPLHPSSTLTLPTATPEQREAAAVLWRSLNAAADGAAMTPAQDDTQAQRIRQLEQQVGALQESVRKNRGHEAELQQRLMEADQQRDALFLYLWPSLGALLLALAGGAYWWHRRTRRAAWWKPESHSNFGEDAITGYGEGFVDTKPEAMESVYPLDADAPATVSPADSVLPAFEENEARKPPPLAVAPLPQAAPHSAEAAARAARDLRSGSSNELADVQQNADFFASLGQYDQAIETLQEYIDEHPGTSPAAYLDLLKLFHTLSLTEPYLKLRNEFNLSFNAEVPTFAAFLKPSRDLQSYADALRQVTEQWNSPAVLDVIESLLVRQEGGGGRTFQLEAFRDLLLLYEVAKAEHLAAGAQRKPLQAPVSPPAEDRTEPGGGEFVPELSTATSRPPLSAPFAAAAAKAPAVAPPPVLDPVFDLPPPVSRDNGLDFDLDDFKSESPAPAVGATSAKVADDHGLAFDFADTKVPPSDEMLSLALPEVELPAESIAPSPPPSGFGPAPSADDNLIDFDLFDVDKTKGNGPHR